jgi:H+/Cl- antiporter ClcA
MKKKLVLRLVAFTAVCLWILTFLGVAVLMFSPLRDLVMFWNGGLNPDFSSVNELQNWMGTAFTVWYVFTVVVVAVFVAWRGFRLVGKWAKEEVIEERSS